MWLIPTWHLQCQYTHAWVMSNIWICSRHVTYLKYKMSRLTHLNESRSHIFEYAHVFPLWRVMSNIWICSRHITHACVRHNSIICVTWCTHEWPIPHLCVWHDSLMCVTWLIHVCHIPDTSQLPSRANAMSWIAWNMCDMTHSHGRHDSFIYETWLIQMCDMTHCYRVLTQYHGWPCMCDMTHSHGRHDSFVHQTWLIQIWDVTHCCRALTQYHGLPVMCVTWLIRTSDIHE